MSESDGTTTGVELFFRNIELLDTVSSLGCEGFIDFKNINIFNGKTSLGQGSWNCVSWTDTHNLWWDTSNSETQNTTVNLAA